METLQQLDAWLEEVLPSNLAALPTRIADSLSSTTQVFVDSTHVVCTTLTATLTQYGPIFPSAAPTPAAGQHAPGSAPSEGSAGSFMDYFRPTASVSHDSATSGLAVSTRGQSNTLSRAPTDSTSGDKHGSSSLFTTAASTAAIIALGLTTILLIPPARPGFSARYGAIWLPYLPGDLPAHLRSLFTSASAGSADKDQQERRPSSTRRGSGLEALSSSAPTRTEAVLVIGGDTPLGRTVALHLAAQGLIVLPVVTSEAAFNTWSALTPPSSRGYIAPLLLAPESSNSRGSDQQQPSPALASFREQLEGTLARRFPLRTAGDPYARPEEQVRLIGVVNTLSFFLPPSASVSPSTSASRITSQPFRSEREAEDGADDSSSTSTPADSLILPAPASTDASQLSGQLYTHVLAPLALIETILPILRKHAGADRDGASSNVHPAFVLYLRPASSPSTSAGPTAAITPRTDEMLQAALDRALSSLRNECRSLDKAERDREQRIKNKKGKSKRSRDSSGGGNEDSRTHGDDGVRRYTPGQYDARFFIRFNPSKKAEDPEAGSTSSRLKPGQTRRRGPIEPAIVPSVKIVDVQLSSWVTSVGNASLNNAVPASAILQAHPFQTRGTPASTALLPHLTDIVRLFRLSTSTARKSAGAAAGRIRVHGPDRAARCPETIVLSLLPPAAAGARALGTHGTSAQKLAFVQHYIRLAFRSLIGGGGGGGQGVVGSFALRLGRGLGSALAWVGVDPARIGLGFGARRLGGGGGGGGGAGRYARRRDEASSSSMADAAASGPSLLVRRRTGSAVAEPNEDLGSAGGYEILQPAPLRDGGAGVGVHMPHSVASSGTIAPYSPRMGASTGTGAPRTGGNAEFGGRTALRPSPHTRASQQQQPQSASVHSDGAGSGVWVSSSNMSSPASSVRGGKDAGLGMVMPPAPSASASPPILPVRNPHLPHAGGTPGGASASGSGSADQGHATPLSLSASVMELPSSVPSSAYGDHDGEAEYDSYESGVESNVSSAGSRRGRPHSVEVVEGISQSVAETAVGPAEAEDPHSFDADRTPGVEGVVAGASAVLRAEAASAAQSGSSRQERPAPIPSSSSSTILGESWVAVSDDQEDDAKQ